MSGKQPPSSPLKIQPNPKRPKTPQPAPMPTRGACAINPQSYAKYDDIVLKPISQFDGKNLPSNADILQRMFYERDFNNPTLKKSTKEIVDNIFPEIEAIYQKVPVDMQRKDSCKRKIVTLFENWLKHQKNEAKSAPSVVSAFKKELNSLCNLLPADAIDRIAKDRGRTPKQIQEDIKFLQSQMTDRKSSLLPNIDQSFTQRQERILQRQIRSNNVPSTSVSNSNPPTGVQQSSIEYESSDDDESTDPDFNAPIQRNSRKRGPNVAKDPKVLANFDRTGLSTRGATRNLAAAANAFGHDLSSLTLSKSTLHRERSKFRASAGKQLVFDI